MSKDTYYNMEDHDYGASRNEVGQTDELETDLDGRYYTKDVVDSMHGANASRITSLEKWKDTAEPNLQEQESRINGLEDWRNTVVGPTLDDHGSRITQLEGGHSATKPYCVLRHSKAQTVGDGTATGQSIVMEWDQVVHDNANMYKPPQRIRIPESGLYLIGSHCVWGTNSTAYAVYIRIWLVSSSSTVIARATTLEDGRTLMSTNISTVRYLNAGNEIYVDATSNNNNGYPRVIQSNNSYSPYLYVAKI